MSTTPKDNFQFFINADIIEKKDDKNKVHKYIKGYASTPDKDRQKETLNPNGFDIEPLLEYGWINYDHHKKEIIGVPTTAKIDSKGLYLEAELLDIPDADRVWNLANALKKASNKRSLGFSIEGKVLERDKKNRNIINRAIITNVAVTPTPVNPYATFEPFSKALVSGYKQAYQKDGMALVEQNLDTDLSITTYETFNDKPEYEETNNANGDIWLSKNEAFIFLSQFQLPSKVIEKIIAYTEKRSNK